MAQVTDICALPYPELTDIPNIPLHIQGLAEGADTLVISKHASAAARDVAITSPQNGQHVFLLDDHRFYVYRSDYSSWSPYQTSDFRVKSALEDLGNSTTLQDDNHITGIQLKAAGKYIIRGVLFVISPAAADLKINLSFSTGLPSGVWCCKTDIAGGLVHSIYGDIDTVLSPPTQGAPSVQFMSIEGYMVNTASPATVKLQWAKNSADAGTTTLFGGSYLEFLEVTA